MDARFRTGYDEQRGEGHMFREGRIYVLPNGRELMASGDGSSFYANEGDDVLQYQVNESGRLVCRGRLTAWSVDDLREAVQQQQSRR